MVKCPKCKSKMFETKGEITDNYDGNFNYCLTGLSYDVKDYVVFHKISYFSCPKCKTDKQNMPSKSHKHFIFVKRKIYAFGFWGSNYTHWEFWGLGVPETFIFR